MNTKHGFGTASFLDEYYFRPRTMKMPCHINKEIGWITKVLKASTAGKGSEACIPALDSPGTFHCASSNLRSHRMAIDQEFCTIC